MTQTLMSPPATTVSPELTERCDRCGAAARMTVALTAGGELAFCGHHGNRYADQILTVAARVTVESGFDWRWAGVNN
jgi:hypothetical protein